MKFLVSETYSEITPESAEHGDFSDHGYVFEDEIYTLSELKEFIKLWGYYNEGGSTWLSTEWYTKCYHSGTERQENLHIKLIKENEK